jgi:hypothetical protein
VSALAGLSAARDFRPGEQVNQVLPPSINRGRGGPPVEIAQPPSHDSEYLDGKARDWRGEVKLANKPRLHGVLIDEGTPAR